MKKSFFNFEKDGVSQNKLGLFLECRRKARWYLLGWITKAVSMAQTYGSIGHLVLEKAYQDVHKGKLKALPSKPEVHRYISTVEKVWHTENPRAEKKALEFLELSLLIAEATMPLYFDFWHKDLKQLLWVNVEKDFRIPYTFNVPELKKDVSTFLIGRSDGVYKLKREWVFENKFKSQISEIDLVDCLPFDHQCLFYLYVRFLMTKKYPAGILYNIVRRVGLRQGKKENIKQFAKRCVADITQRPDWYFMRLEISVDKHEIDAYKAELDDLLRDFYLWWNGMSGDYKNTNACLNKYGRCKYLTACATGNMKSYLKRKTPTREIETI